MKSYSESHRADLFVVHALNGNRGGFFVEAGALDGVRGSNTLLLEREYGWTGICIEPDPELFAELVANRGQCICENACLYDGSEVTFIAGVNGWGGIRDHLLEATASSWQSGRQISMATVSLASVLDKHSAPSVIDYLSLDTEGSELPIMREFPFDRYRFRVVSIEGFTCDELFLGHGYETAENPHDEGPGWERFFISGGGSRLTPT